MADGAYRVRLDRAAIAALGNDLAAAEETVRAAEGVAALARADAPKRSGDGARSIRPWPGRDQRGPYADVSWDDDHYYMSFHEDGTSRGHKAQHFLRSALDRYKHL